LPQRIHHWPDGHPNWNLDPPARRPHTSAMPQQSLKLRCTETVTVTAQVSDALAGE
jgi:hypothetical protein